LAVSLAASFGLTLVGFLRGSRANVYAGSERITFPKTSEAQR
jgi:FdhD protein